MFQIIGLALEQIAFRMITITELGDIAVTLTCVAIQRIKAELCILKNLLIRYVNFWIKDNL